MPEYSFSMSLLKLDLKGCSLTPPWLERNWCQPAAKEWGNNQGLGIEHRVPEAARADQSQGHAVTHGQAFPISFSPLYFPAVCQPFRLSSQLNSDRGEVIPSLTHGRLWALRKEHPREGRGVWEPVWRVQSCLCTLLCAGMGSTHPPLQLPLSRCSGNTFKAGPPSKFLGQL